MITQASNSEKILRTKVVTDLRAEPELQTTSTEEIAHLEIEAKQALERRDYYHLAYSKY